MVAPVFNNLDDTPGYTENSSSVVLDADATIVDPDVGAFDGATLTLTRSGGANPDDIFGDNSGLLEENQVLVAGLLIGSYTVANGALIITFNGDADQTSVNQVLQALTYANASDVPPASVTIDYVFDNGEQATGSITVAITSANDPPAISGLNPASFYQPGSAGVVLSPGITLGDSDSTDLAGATVRISANFTAGDILSADTGSTGIVASYNAGTGELTLSGTATLAQYRQVLATVAYSSSDPNAASAGQRALEWSVDDGAAGSGTTSTLVDFFPTVDLDQNGAGIDFATTFSEGGGAVAIADSDAVMVSSSSISSITVVLTNAKPGDMLSVSAGPLDVETDTSVPGQITLTIRAAGFNTPSDATLRSITFGNANANVDPAPRSLTVIVSDENNVSVAAHSTVSVSGAVNDPGSAADDTATTADNTTLVVAAAQGVLANDNDPDGLGVITGTVVTSQGSTIQFGSDGSYSYTPAPFFVGTEDIGYTAQDPFGSQVSATLHITVAAVNDPGSAQDDSAETAANTTLVVAAAQGVLANDNDPDGLTVITGTVATSQGGTIQFGTDGSYTYTPPASFAGPDSVAYTARDSFGSEIGANLRITVAPPPGTAGDDSYTAPLGNATIDAGLGDDSIVFDFSLTDAVISWSGNRVTIDGPSSHTALSGFERYRFTDGTVDNRDGNPLVDDLFYFSRNHDVWAARADADEHYQSTGWHEGRDPNAFFSTTIYLSANPDVRAAHVDALAHFDQVGWLEDRIPSLAFDPSRYLEAYPDVAAAHIDPLAHFLQNGYQENRQPFTPSELIAANGFDYVYYLQHNPDVAAAHIDPLSHFLTSGWQEGRNPNALFDVSGYLATYADVAAAQVNPLVHYDQFGRHEGRDPSVGFDTTAYLAAYPDVAAAQVNPLVHFLQFGQHEGRSPFADGAWG